jgi:hypothetical protein
VLDKFKLFESNKDDEPTGDADEQRCLRSRDKSHSQECETWTKRRYSSDQLVRKNLS